MSLECRQAVLFDFSAGCDFPRIEARSVTVSPARCETGRGLHLCVKHDQDWPGIVLPAPAGSWDLSACGFVSMNVKNTGQNAVTVHCRVDNAGADGVNHCCTGSLALQPGAAGVLQVELKIRRGVQFGVELFGMRGYPPGVRHHRLRLDTLDATQVTQLFVYVVKPVEDHEFEIDHIRAGGTNSAPPEDGIEARKIFPFIDTFGQYIHRDWPGKIHSLAELQGRVAEEEKDLAARPEPEGWDVWGGWKNGPTLPATGFFRVANRKSSGGSSIRTENSSGRTASTASVPGRTMSGPPSRSDPTGFRISPVGSRNSAASCRTWLYSCR